MKPKILGLLAAALLAGPMAANAITWNANATFESGASLTGTLTLLNNSCDEADDFNGSFSIVSGNVTTNIGGNNTGGLCLDSVTAVFAGWSVGGQTLTLVFSPLMNLSAPANSYALTNFGAFNGDDLMTSGSLTRVSVPEPATLALLSLGLLGLGLTRRIAT